MYSPEIRSKFEAELQHADLARASGNEGKARVCARRAAGIAAKDFLERSGEPATAPSVIDLLHQLRALPGIPPDIQGLIDYLLMRVTPDYQLPVPVDLVTAARRLIDFLETFEPQA